MNSQELTELAQERAKSMGGRYIGCTDGPVSEFFPKPADEPITVNGVVIEVRDPESSKPVLSGPRVIVTRAEKRLAGGIMGSSEF